MLNVWSSQYLTMYLLFPYRRFLGRTWINRHKTWADRGLVVTGVIYRNLRPGWTGPWTPPQKGKWKQTGLGCSPSPFSLSLWGNRADSRFALPGFVIWRYPIVLGRTSSRYPGDRVKGPWSLAGFAERKDAAHGNGCLGEWQKEVRGLEWAAWDPWSAIFGTS